MALKRLRRMPQRRNRFVRSRRRVFKRRLRFRRRPISTLFTKLTRSVQVYSDARTGGVASLHQTLEQFSEHKNLAPNFERVKIYRLNVRVFPQQNVANNTSSRVTNYAIVPYHRPLVKPATPNFPTCLSIDKSKIRRMTQFGRMSFVPAVRLGTDTETSTLYNTTKWRPEFDIGVDADKEILYCGFLCFEGDSTIAESHPVNFTVVMDLFVKYKNQRSFI
ncbi:capsid protein [Human associated cyclovirus 2]|uniref:Capsid protein n=1 Tax=Human associated cyclovirus 2 TaxID=2038720 RepID=D4N3N7_9CIRC|nr:capsid protein [Cyclovirus PK5006]ADD62452.1 capsid protein [Cyclovirus PK5006]